MGGLLGGRITRNLFPRVNVTGAAPNRSLFTVRQMAIPGSNASDIFRRIVGPDLSPGEMAVRYRNAAVDGGADFTRKLHDVLTPHRSTIDGIKANLSPEQQRGVVLVSDASPTRLGGLVQDGHAMVMMMSGPPPDLEVAAQFPTRTFRTVFGAFPGGHAQFDPETQNNFVSAIGDRPTPAGIAAAMAAVRNTGGRFAAFNGNAFRTGAPLAGSALLGSSSIITMEAHQVIQLPDGILHSLANSTSPVHALRGLAGFYLYECATGRYWVSLHVGQATMPFLDRVNTPSAANVFALSFERMQIMVDRFPEYVQQLGEPEACELFLSDAYANAFQEDAWAGGRYGEILDYAIQTVLDSTGGNVAEFVNRYVQPDGVLPKLVDVPADMLTSRSPRDILTFVDNAPPSSNDGAVGSVGGSANPGGLERSPASGAGELPGGGAAGVGDLPGRGAAEMGDLPGSTVEGPGPTMPTAPEGFDPPGREGGEKGL